METKPGQHENDRYFLHPIVMNAYKVIRAIDSMVPHLGPHVKHREIALKVNMSLSAVEHITRIYRAHGVIGSVKGPGSGVYPIIPLEEITVANLMDMFTDRPNKGIPRTLYDLFHDAFTRLSLDEIPNPFQK